MMKKLSSLLLLTGLCLTACKKTDGEVELPGPTGADFKITVQSISPAQAPDDKNYVIVENTSGFASTWSFEGDGVNKKTSSKQKDSIYYRYKGTYNIKLTTASKGGVSTVTKTVTIAEDSKIPCDFTVTKVDENHFTVKNTTPLFVSSAWEFPTGLKSSAVEETIYLPFKGNQDVKLTAELFPGVFVSTTKAINVASDDANNPDLTDPIFIKLTGGIDDADGKTWYFVPDKNISGVGQYKEKELSNGYWNYPDGYTGGAWTNGMLANSYTFILRNYQYIPLNNKVTVHYDWAVLDFGKPFAQYNDIALEDPRHEPAPFVLKNENVGITGYTLKFGKKSYLGYADGRTVYEISKFSANADSVWIRHKYADYTNGDLTKNPNALDPSKDENQRIMIFTTNR